jgi:multidrug efflux pump subunit AcrA (membrane-fusion protein)
MEPEGQASRPAWRWVLAILVLVVLGGVFAAFSRQGPSVQTSSVRRGDLWCLCSATGPGAAPGGELRASDPATVAEIYVQGGSRVRTGEALVRLENTELSRKALDAQSEALRLESERATATADVSELERKEKQAAKVFEADGRLLAGGAITKMTYEQDEAALSEARDRARAARAHLEALDGARDGASRVELAHRSAADLERRVAALTVRAPADGRCTGLRGAQAKPSSRGRSSPT